MAVYFIQSAEGDIKIGTAGNPWSRMKELQTGQAKPLKMLCIIDGGRPVEVSIHEAFAEFRMTGEWFSPDPSLLKYIESAKRQRPAPAERRPLDPPETQAPRAQTLAEAMEVDRRRLTDLAARHRRAAIRLDMRTVGLIEKGND